MLKIKDGITMHYARSAGKQFEQFVKLVKKSKEENSVLYVFTEKGIEDFKKKILKAEQNEQKSKTKCAV